MRPPAQRPAVAGQWVVWILAGIAALTLLYGILTGRGSDETETVLAEEKRGYYLADATLTEMDKDGQPRLVVRAKSIEQQLTDQSVRLVELDLDYRTESNVLWTVAADNGRMPPDRSSLLLSGDVVVSSRDVRGSPVVHSDTLAYDTARNVIQTADLVSIRFGHNDLRGRGLQANLNTGTLRLESNVNGRFHP